MEKNKSFLFLQEKRQILQQDVYKVFDTIKNKDLYLNSNEDLLQYMYEKLLQEGDNAIDIGAHYARHLSVIQKRVKNGKVIAFEPIPYLSELLKNQFKDIKNVIIENCALSNEKGVLDFYVYEDSLGESGLNQRTERMKNKGDCEVIQVKVKTLDEYIEEFTSLEFIKIDAESAEMNILYGANKIINKFRPIISIEYGRDVEYFNYSYHSLWEYSQENSYNICDLWGNVYPNSSVWDNSPFLTWDFVLVPFEKYEYFIRKTRN